MANRAYDVLFEKQIDMGSGVRKCPLAQPPPELNPTHLLALRVAALLHDVGHGPLSHIFDLFLASYYTHERGMPNNHEGVTRKIILGEIPGCGDISTFLTELHSKQNAAPILLPENIARLTCGERLTEEAAGGKYRFLGQIISRSWGVDRLDYLRRDALHSGIETGRLDIWNIINSYVIRPPHDEDDKKDDEAEDWSLGIEKDAAVWLEGMLETRDLCYRLLYFSEANRIAVEMVVRAIKERYEELFLAASREARSVSEVDEIWVEMWRRDDCELMEELRNSGNDLCKDLATRIRERNLYEPLPIDINVSADLDKLPRQQLKLIVDTAPEAFREVLEKERDIAQAMKPTKQIKEETVIFDVHTPPLEKAKTFTRKYLYDEQSDRFMSLLEACPNQRLLREEYEAKPYRIKMPLDEIYKGYTQNLRIYWPYELVERLSLKVYEDLGEEKADPGELTKALGATILTAAEQVLEEFMEVVAIEDSEKREELLQRLREGIGFLARDVADELVGQ